MEVFEHGGTRWRFQGLLEALVKLERRKQDIAYLVMLDRSTADGESFLERFDMNAQSLEDASLAGPEGEFIGSEGESDKGLRLSQFFEPLDADDLETAMSSEADDSQAEAEDAPTPRRTPTATPEALFRGACQWLMRLAARNALNQRSRRYRLRAWGAKGGESILTAVFTIESIEPPKEEQSLLSAEEAAQAYERMKQKAQTNDLEVQVDGVRKVIQLFHQLMETSVDWTIQQNRLAQSTVAQMSRQLSDSRAQIDSLIGAVIRQRTELANQQIRREKEARSDSLKGTVVHEATRQLGDALKLYIMSSKDVNPEMGTLLDMLNRNPELMQLLKSPTAQRYLGDPAKLRELLQFLQSMETAERQPTGASPGPTPES